MVTRRHDMPFGAQITEKGVRFRIWAPASSQVDLCLENARAQPMNALGDGWYEFITTQAAPGSRYRFAVNDGLLVPDPASRCNPEDIHGASLVLDPAAYDWQDDGWRGRPWHEAVIYQLHVGCFSPEGSYAGIRKRLNYLAGLGITAIALMPLASCSGQRSWGYDGVLPFAPARAYGTPEDLKGLIQAAHGQGLMVLLDVAYSHFGPEGNYQRVYAPPFFATQRDSPWGTSVDFSSGPVREFFIHNALYWLREYHLDGLRLDAAHTIRDDSPVHFLQELAQRVHREIGGDRHIHLILENDANQSRYLGRGRYTAQWNDDLQHALHVLCTGETQGRYADYAAHPIQHLARSLAQGYAWQGEDSPRHGHAPRGEPSSHLPPQAFVAYLQSHDQVGNRANGERISRFAAPAPLRAAIAIYLLAPTIPMLFMGEEFAAATPFRYFCNFGDDIKAATAAMQRRDYAGFPEPVAAEMPDPNRESTFLACKLDWLTLSWSRHTSWVNLYRELLKLRREVIIPRLAGMTGNCSKFKAKAPGGLRVGWLLGDGSALWLMANLSDDGLTVAAPTGQRLYATSDQAMEGRLEPWAVAWTLQVAASREDQPPAGL